MLNLTEIFASVQGESRLSGLPTTFVRLAACNLRCSWCDTPYSFGRGTATPLEAVVRKVEQNGCPYVCITGGEPLLQENVHSLMKRLCDLGYRLSLETGGSLSIEKVDPRVSVILDIKCPGSGMAHKNRLENLALLKPIDEVKFVLKERSDYDWAKALCEEKELFSRKPEVLFSPVHGILNPQELVGWILEDKIPVRLNLQIHKFIWSPETKGV